MNIVKFHLKIIGLCLKNLKYKLGIFDGNENFKKLFHIKLRGFVGHDGGHHLCRLKYILKGPYVDISDYEEIAIMDKRWGNYKDIFYFFYDSIMNMSD
jgi:hypothetical protein